MDCDHYLHTWWIWFIKYTWVVVVNLAYKIEHCCTIEYHTISEFILLLFLSIGIYISFILILLEIHVKIKVAPMFFYLFHQFRSCFKK
jgi:hypothetical protein